MSFVKELVLALDLEDRRSALKIAENLSDLVDRFKVNYPLIISSGIRIISEISELKPVIADLKIADVPHIAAKIAEIAFRNDAQAVIIHGFAGSDMMKAVLSVAKRYGCEVYVVTELSSEGGKEFMGRFSIEIAKMAKDNGCNGLIAPATRLDKLKEIREAAGDIKILCPGIGAQGGSLDALKFADGIIVGRSIYLAENPREVARELRSRVQAYSFRP
uniref:Orotidine 5'-phosphate decarboxylase n=1 Tax=Archaeoglobus fulgidus TaxID=2234 RepID=A0A7J2THA8_ARCFL